MKANKKEGLLKRLKNIEGKDEEQLKLAENKKEKQLGIESVNNMFDKKLSPEAKNMIVKLSNQEEIIKYKWPYFKPSSVNEFEFIDYMSLEELLKGIHYRNLSIENAENKQDGFMAVFITLKKIQSKKS